jgi:hypothetical protein
MSKELFPARVTVVFASGAKLSVSVTDEEAEKVVKLLVELEGRRALMKGATVLRQGLGSLAHNQFHDDVCMFANKVIANAGKDPRGVPS